MGSGEGLAVRPEALEGEARVLGEAAEGITAALAVGAGGLADAVEALGGWESGAALERCRAAWVERLSALAAEFEDRARRLRETAGNYREAEQRAVDGLRELPRAGWGR
ncbi:type VII secretion target [Streptacidiphilus albus]|uniref:type VII secretion target n=1 Tax=Streptacidiphilus albus TaxID=105425 RepID=UPI00054C4E2B|nr:type VII secretion target [Streptacidiphilus albus]